MTDPLRDPWTGPLGLPRFDLIEDEMFRPAFEAALAEARAEIAAIADNPDPPDFDNTLGALERSGAALDRVSRIFFHLVATDATPGREALQREIVPELSAYSSEIVSNRALWDRIERVWEGRASLGPEEARVLELTLDSFRRAGAALDGAARERMTEIKSRLARLGTAFTQNLLADERGWTMPLDEAALAPLPGFLAGALRAAGEERGLDGPALTLARSVIVPFLQFCPDRALRRRAYEAWAARGARGGDTDNRAIAAEILALRAERAALLGYDSFAAFKLEPEMAQSPDRVKALLMDVWAPARARAEADAEQLERLLVADGEALPLEPWDWRYYAEARRRAEYDIDEAALKPHFQLDRMIDAAFDVAGRLFGLEARPLDAPLAHPDARAWEITRDGRHMAVFVGDHFARPGKRSGAWCSSLQSQHKLDGGARAIVVNVCNFARPAEGAPALLSFDDARTLFHEFGHALHHILSDVTWPSVSGTSVARDFVELPSQLFEHWLDVPEVLDRYALHAGTGAPLPAEMRDRLLAAATFDSGFETVEYVASALVDLAFHEGEPPADPLQREAEVLAEIGMPRAIGMRHATPHFAHVFAGDGYSSGYYSYMWSEVMDADAFAAFEEAGDPFDPDIAAQLERHVLSAGGSAAADALYTAFRGRMPGVEALLRGRGLAPTG